ncbi:Dihydroceramide fatty acyl 2-hydroxylase (Partial), partial [Seminavis robusta]
KDYQAWVHEYRVSTPVTFFESKVVNALTKCPWWTAPLVWIPIICYLTVSPGFSSLDTTVLFASGFLFWPGLEYTLHRFVFHAHTETYWANIIHFLLHGNHHVCPTDKLRLVFPPLPAAAIACILSIPPNMLLGRAAANCFMGGFMTGYLFYDLTHYSIHNLHLKATSYEDGSAYSTFVATQFLPWLQNLRMHHGRHHKEGTSGFGISNASLDVVLGRRHPQRFHLSNTTVPCYEVWSYGTGGRER